MLAGQSGVADLGCGWMILQRYLDHSTNYVPVDLIARDPRTIICDFNREPPPKTGVPAAACLGLLGYLDRPDQFMNSLSQLHRLAVVSYKVRDADPPGLDRRSEALVNDLSSTEIEALFKGAGWNITTAVWFDTRQILWSLSSTRASAA